MIKAMEETSAKMIQEDREMVEREAEIEADSCLDTNMVNLAEMNLILVLAYCSLPEEQIELPEPRNREIDKPEKKKNPKSRSQGRKQETNEFRPKSTRLQHTKIRDCRHARRM